MISTNQNYPNYSGYIPLCAFAGSLVIYQEILKNYLFFANSVKNFSLLSSSKASSFSVTTTPFLSSAISKYKADKVVKQLNLSSEITPFPREPLENCVKRVNLVEPELKFAKLISYERFISSLRRSFFTTLQSIPFNEDYIILTDDKEKSTNWVVSHVLGMIEEHPPKFIVNKKDLATYKTQYPEIKHVIMIDDGAYSGEQASRYITNFFSSNFCLHVCIPYMTSYAKNRIASACKNIKIPFIFSDHQIMLSYSELGNLGYYNYFQAYRPNIKHLISMDLPVPEKNWTSAEKLEHKKIKEQILLLRKNIFKMSDSEVYEGLQKIENELNRILKDSNSNDGFQGRIESYRKDIKISLEPVLRYKSSPVVISESTKTPTLMSHKYPDFLSTNPKTCLASQTEEPIPPYKNSTFLRQKRELQIQRLLLEESNKKGITLDQTYEKTGRLASERIVQSNRGCFILANNYCQIPENNEGQITLRIGEYKFPFGGKTGLPQWFLEEGQKVVLEKATSSSIESKTIRYQQGNLFIEKASCIPV